MKIQNEISRDTKMEMPTVFFTENNYLVQTGNFLKTSEKKYR